MADNYLEKKLDDYRSGKLHHAAKSHASAPPAARAYIVGGCSAKGRNHIDKLRGYGWKVAFCDTDEKNGRNVAQATGSQFHPINELTEATMNQSLKIVEERWGGVDFIILTDSSQAGLFDNAETRYGATVSLLL